MADRIRAIWFLTWMPLLAGLSVTGIAMRGEWFRLGLMVVMALAGAAAGAWLRPWVARMQWTFILEPLVVAGVAVAISPVLAAGLLGQEPTVLALIFGTAFTASATYPEHAAPVPARFTALRGAAAVAVLGGLAMLIVTNPGAGQITIGVVAFLAALAHPFLRRLQARTPAPVQPIAPRPGVVDARGRNLWGTLFGAAAAGLVLAFTHFSTAYLPLVMDAPLDRTRAVYWVIGVTLGWGVGATIAAALRPRRTRVPAWAVEAAVAVLALALMMTERFYGYSVDVVIVAIVTAAIALHPRGPFATWGERVPGRLWWIAATVGALLFWGLSRTINHTDVLLLAAVFAIVAIFLPRRTAQPEPANPAPTNAASAPPTPGTPGSPR